MELACLHRHKTQGRYFKVREKGAITVVLFTIFPLDMSGRGHRKLRLCSRKNYERKKLKKRSTPPSTCTSLKVSMPFELLPPQSLTVSLPISLFHDAPLSTFESLKARVECAGVIPQGIYYVHRENTPLCKRRCYISQIDIHSLIHIIMYNYTVMCQYNQKSIAYTYNYFDYCIYTILMKVNTYEFLLV